MDGYIGYRQTGAILVGCWAHARRKFHEAKVAQANKKVGKADLALGHIQKLYRIEKQIKEKSSAERHQARAQSAAPILKQFKRWLDKSAETVLPNTLLGKAIQYSLNQWPYLVRYVEDGRLSIDNNRAERAIKPFVIGRKNWLFSITDNGANASAMLYSIIETAKANGVEPFAYIMRCLAHLSISPEDLDAIMPWTVTWE